MRILVIGGSYFFGRWFVQVTYRDHDIILLNRGSIKTGLDGVLELVCDRHDKEGLKALSPTLGAIDVVVDFCAYEKGDIDGILEFLDTDRLSRYIFISTVDVYKHDGDRELNEDAPMADDFVQGPQGDYIAGKVALECELRSAEAKYGIKGVSVRPAVLYGPLNYAPRESIYFEWIDKAGQIIHPLDADGYWQMVYVGDAARALKIICELPDDETDRAYNFCTGDRISYDVFEKALEALGTPFEKVDIPVKEADERYIPLPFPLRAEESAYYSPDRFEKLLPDTTGLVEGLLRARKV